MSERLRCARGHEWDASAELGTLEADPSRLCPICNNVDITPPPPGNSARASRRPVDSDHVPTSYPVVAGYEILGVLGRGGMGVVYKARQVRLNRLVALKMILAGAHAGPEEMVRFQREARAVARLQHPNVVQIHEIGDVNELPYFALEFIEGGSLLQHLDGTPWPARNAAALIEVLARAMHAAHEHGIVHRDLKPANILLQKSEKHNPKSEKQAVVDVGSRFSELVPKIADFGLAKRVGLETDITREGAVVGTPSYMAPEQAGQGQAIGPMADVYALGAILYELLTGRPPFKGPTPVDTILLVLSQDVVAPSRLHPRLAADLETICLKCLQKEPHKRYASALALADDLHRFLAGEPIMARPIGALERRWKWAKRRPALAAFWSVTAAALATVLIGSAVYNSHLQRALEDAHNQQVAADEARGQAEANDQESRRRLVRLYVSSGMNRLEAGDQLNALPYLAEALRLESDQPDLARVHRLRFGTALRQCPRPAHIWIHPEGGVTALALSKDKKRVATAAGGLAHVWDVKTGQAVAPSLKHGGGLVNAVEFSPDGTRLLTAGGTPAAKIWDLASGKALLELKYAAPIVFAAYSPDGHLVVTTSTDGTARVWDANTGGAVGAPLRHQKAVMKAAFSPDSRLVATVSLDETARLWNAATGEPVFAPFGLEGAVFFRDVAFTADGHTLLTRGVVVKLWDVQTGKMVFQQAAFGWTTATGLSPDGLRILAGSNAGLGHVWGTRASGELVPPLQHGATVSFVTFSPDGTILLTCSNDKTARLWSARTGEPLTPPLPHHGPVVSGAFITPRELLTASTDGAVRLWRVPLPAAVLTPWDTYLGRVVFSNDNRLVAIFHGDNVLPMHGIYDVQTGRLRRSFLTKLPVNGFAFSPDGRSYATSSDPEHAAYVWDLETGRRLIGPLQHDGAILTIDFSPDGKMLVTGANDGTARVWRAADGAAVGEPLRHRPQPIWVARFAPDSRRVLTATHAGRAIVWDVASGKRICLGAWHGASIREASFSPDGRRFLTASFAGTARVWDAATGEPVTPFMNHPGRVLQAGFSPDGRLVFTGSDGDSAVRIWDATTGSALSAPLEQLPRVGSGGFGYDGLVLAAGGRFWEVATLQPITPPAPGADRNYPAVSADGRYLAVHSWRLPDYPEPPRVHIWSLTSFDRPVDDAVREARLRSASRVDNQGNLQPLDLTQLRSAFEELRSRYPADFQSP
jgi:eukaryotic-like serine/threonine-protein kinase